MTIRQFAAGLLVTLALAACGTDTYESVSKDIDGLMAEQIPLTADNKAQITALREQAEQLQQAGKNEESVAALKQIRDIMKKARDADLLRKSEG